MLMPPNEHKQIMMKKGLLEFITLKIKMRLHHLNLNLI